MNNTLITSLLTKLYGKGTCQIALKNDKLENQFLVISGHDGPKWIIPRLAKYGLKTLSQWRPYSIKALVKWKLILYAYRLGFLAKLSNIDCITFTPSSGEYNTPQTFSLTKTRSLIYIGTQSTTQKAVVLLVERTETAPYGVVKLPLGALSGTQIKQENTILKQVPERLKSIAPQILVTQYKQFCIQQWVEGKATGRSFTHAHIDLLLALKNETSIDFYNSYFSLQKNLLSLEKSQTLLSIQTYLTQIPTEIKLPSVWVHGDFAPWNIKINASSLCLIDWEDAKPSGLPLQDLLHFHVIQGFLFGKDSQVLMGLFNNKLVKIYLNALQIRIPLAQNLTQYYLINAWYSRTKFHEIEHADYLYQLLTSLKGI